MKKGAVPIGLYRALVLRVVPFALLVFMIIGLAVVAQTTNSVLMRVKANHREQHRYAEGEVRRKLETLKASIQALAGNDLIVNALIDITDRDHYLPIFFRSLRIPGPEAVRIALVDYKGRRIIANQPHGGSYEGSPLLATVAGGESYFELIPERMLFAAPVVYHGVTEGAMVVAYSTAQFPGFFSLEVGVDGLAVTGRQGGRIYVSPVAADERLPWSRDPDQWLVMRKEIEGYGGLTLETAVNKERALASVQSVRDFYLIAISALFIALLLAILMMGRFVTNPVLSLIAGIRDIIEADDLTLQLKEKGPSELQDIARVFNKLLSRLQTTMISRENLTRMIDAMAEGVLVMSKDLRIVSVNPACCQLLGYESSDLIGKPAHLFFDAGIFGEIQEKVRGAGRLNSREMTILDREGRELTALISCSAISGAPTAPKMFIHVIHNITSWKKIQLELDAQRERLDLVIKGTNIGVWDWNVQTGETVFNERWAGIVGYTLEELSPVSIKTWLDLCHPEDRKTSGEMLERHFSGLSDHYELECRMRHKDGHWVWVHDRGMVVEWAADGRPLRMSGTHADITGRKRAEEALRLTNETLEQRVQERSRALEETHGRMVMQEKMASIGQLAAGIAHELNNPINFVRTNFATLTDNFSDIIDILGAYRNLTGELEMSTPRIPALDRVLEKEREFQIDFIAGDIPQIFKESEDGFERIARIIQSMRDFSHVDRRAELGYFNVNRGIEDTLVIARSEYKYHAEVQVELGRVPEIRCFPGQINQVFLNLIVNCAHAISSQKRETKGVIRIRTWQDEANVYCEIGDDGPGIPEQIRSRIFEPFFTTKPPGQGTGLGLSISYDIVVRKHNGELSVRSGENGGTVFTLRIPFNPQAVEVEDEIHS